MSASVVLGPCPNCHTRTGVHSGIYVCCWIAAGLPPNRTSVCGRRFPFLSPTRPSLLMLMIWSPPDVCRSSGVGFAGCRPCDGLGCTRPDRSGARMQRWRQQRGRQR